MHPAPNPRSATIVNAMESLLQDILNALRAGETVDANRLAALVRAHNNGVHDVRDHIAKKRLYPFYLQMKQNDRAAWQALGLENDPELENRLIAVLRMKPRRTASGVATITVITRPHACSSACLYCPNDVRMPKSYLANEPACQRAERNWFDPYLQVASRMKALTEMGHATDKVELIVLGGTWSDYPESYRLWFARELFRALNEWPDVWSNVEARKAAYRQAGVANENDALERQTHDAQAAVTAGEITYNEAINALYEQSENWQAARAWQTATWADVEREQRANEQAAHRVVGFVVETRPDLINPQTLTEIRRLGCTKVQIGIQSLNERVLAANNRKLDRATIDRAFSLLRLFGFKIHTHFMLNLLGSTPADDIADYRRFVTEQPLQPDEVKLYPCALVAGTGLEACYRAGTWQPYSEDDLVNTLAEDVMATPCWMRVSRMIRDISAGDILCGNKKTNLRQMVEGAINDRGLAPQVREIRFREISTNPPTLESLTLRTTPYETDSTSEYFLEWVAPDNRIAGFLRLSLPHPHAFDEISVDAGSTEGDRNASESITLPPQLNDTAAMIREVHVYGAVARVGEQGAATGAQHHGLGRALVEAASDIARAHGYNSINVISSVGTREYYRNLGFTLRDLYMSKEL